MLAAMISVAKSWCRCVLSSFLPDDAGSGSEIRALAIPAGCNEGKPWISEQCWRSDYHIGSVAHTIQTAFELVTGFLPKDVATNQRLAREGLL